MRQRYGGENVLRVAIYLMLQRSLWNVGLSFWIMWMFITAAS